jgi:hypothetical protein
VLRAVPSITEAEVTTSGCAGPPPGAIAASFSRSRTDFRSSRSRSRRSVRGRFRLAIAPMLRDRPIDDSGLRTSAGNASPDRMLERWPVYARGVKKAAEAERTAGALRPEQARGGNYATN